MSGLLPSQIDDLVETTLNSYTRDKWSDLSFGLQEYFAMGNMVINKRVGIDGGMALQWQVRFSNSGNAKWTTLYSKDVTNIDQIVKKAEVDFKFLETSFGYDVREECFNASPAALISTVNTRRHAAFMDLAELMEEAFWGAPANATDLDELKKPYGLLYWLVPNATEGFNGGNPTGFSSVAGIDSSNATYARHRNYTGEYVTVSKADLVRKMRKAAYKTKFKSPVPYPNVKDSGIRRALCTTYDVIATMEEILETQNDNLGNDVASKDGSVVFRGNSLLAIPYLDANAVDGSMWKKDPVIGLDLNSFKVLFKKGHVMRRSNITPADSHNARTVFFDSSFQIVCYERRSNFYLYRKAA